MANFMGGSAYAMSKDIAEGYVLLNANLLKKFTPVELAQLRQQLEKVQKEIRSEQPAQDDVQAIQKRGRKISRVSSALLVLDTLRKR
ncbi:MAG TPA: hypothetical protein VGR67_06595 [Candidatus Polarisedimenticolia bacterium]|jgi:hypothetical protein|nr:hypothetical protein [Candidatus Polarisedimenticolia bacterium]